MNNESIKFRIKWIAPQELFVKVQQLDMVYSCFDMDKVVVSEFSEDNSDYDIVIDALSDIGKITVQEQFLQSLEERYLRYFIRSIKSQINRLGLLEQFVSEIRKLYTYAMEHFPKEKMRYKLFYATIGDYNYINSQSLEYLREYALYEDAFDDERGCAYYLLGLNEPDPMSSKKLFRKALGVFEVARLDEDFNFEIYACEHALCLIEWADIVNANRLKYREKNNTPCKLAYDKAIDIMKPYIKYEVSRMERFTGDQRMEYENYIRSLVEKIDNRLKVSQFATRYCGILPKFADDCINKINEQSDC